MSEDETRILADARKRRRAHQTSGERIGELEFILEMEKHNHRTDNEYLVKKVHAYEAVLERAAEGEVVTQAAIDVLAEWQLKN